jgi:hypothetical protein
MCKQIRVVILRIFFIYTSYTRTLLTSSKSNVLWVLYVFPALTPAPFFMHQLKRLSENLSIRSHGYSLLVFLFSILKRHGHEIFISGLFINQSPSESLTGPPWKWFAFAELFKYEHRLLCVTVVAVKRFYCYNCRAFQNGSGLGSKCSSYMHLSFLSISLQKKTTFQNVVRLSAAKIGFPLHWTAL